MTLATGFITRVRKGQLELISGRKKNGRKGIFHLLLEQKHQTESNKSSRQRVMTSSTGSQPELNHRSYSYVCTSTDLCPGFVLFICLFGT